MGSGEVSLVIIKLPYCLCGELVVVCVELVTASEALVLPNVLFLIRTKSGSVSSSLCPFCMFSFKNIMLCSKKKKINLNKNFLWI